MSIFITEDNWPDIKVDLDAQGLSFGALPRTTNIGDSKYSLVFAEHVSLIPESEWKDRIREMANAGAFIGQRFKFSPKDNFQNGYSLCWAYSLAQACMGNRGQQGQKFVQLSADSLAEDVGFRNAGNSLDSALEYAATHGIASREFVPQYDIKQKNWKPGWEVDRQNYIPLEWWDLGGKDIWAETVTSLLSGHGCYVGYNWASHAVWLDMLGINDKGQIMVHTPNSHGEGNDWWLVGSRAIPSMGSFVIRSMTLSDIEGL